MKKVTQITHSKKHEPIHLSEIGVKNKRYKKKKYCKLHVPCTASKIDESLKVFKGLHQDKE